MRRLFGISATTVHKTIWRCSSFGFINGCKVSTSRGHAPLFRRFSSHTVAAHQGLFRYYAARAAAAKRSTKQQRSGSTSGKTRRGLSCGRPRMETAPWSAIALVTAGLRRELAKEDRGVSRRRRREAERLGCALLRRDADRLRDDYILSGITEGYSVAEALLRRRSAGEVRKPRGGRLHISAIGRAQTHFRERAFVPK
jgi:hypothetical protein